MSESLIILKKYWDHSSFRPLQKEIIDSVQNGRDVLAILPTGGGKSICFQVPALIKEGVCIVITPLIALMKDQIENLKNRGIQASAVFSGMPVKEVDITLDNCIYGKTRFLYVSPERIQSELFRERVKRMNVNLIAVDEAHCISQWGHDFRPAYLDIKELRNIVPGVNLVALTATATMPVRQEIAEYLLLTDPEIFTGTFARPNLSYSVRKVEDKESKLIGILKKIPGTSIVYSKTRKECREISGVLRNYGFSSGYYHAGLSPSERIKAQNQWKAGKIRIIVATNAFGMGIDKPDVRSVIHMEFPKNMEAYYQEAGRAGRDGEKSFAIILYQQKDIEESTKAFERSYPELKFIQHVYQCLANYYKLAVGSEHGTGFDFALHKFSVQYNMDHLEVFYALKRLEDENLIQLSEGFFGFSSAYIQLDHDDLYNFQVANANLDPLIKALLRLHGGELFTQFTRISEYKIATVLKQTESEVKAGLERLHKLGVLIYSSSKDVPQIVFLTPRMDAGKLPIDRKSLKRRRKVEKEKLNFMIRYIEGTSNCRTNIIQDYFGEEISGACGVCDTCIEKLKFKKNENGNKALVDIIVSSLKDRSMKMEALIEFHDGYNSKEILQAVRLLLDSGMVKVDGHGNITSQNH